MPSWQGQSRGNPAGYRIFIFILKKFGVRPAYLLLRFVAGWFFLTSTRTSRFVYRLFRDRLGRSRLRAAGMVYANYYRLGQTIIDRIVAMSGIPNRFSFDFDGEEYLRAMVREGRGGLLLSAHLGNWEIAGHLLQRLDTKINIVMYDGEHRRIKEYLDGVTGDRRANIIIIREDLSHIYAISEALARNELLCMHADRFVEGNKTLLQPFLGLPARFPAGPFQLAATFKVPVSFVFAVKETALHYRFSATPPRVAAGKSGIPALLDDFSRAFGEKTRAYPTQWFNYYDFWERG